MGYAFGILCGLPGFWVWFDSFGFDGFSVVGLMVGLWFMVFVVVVGFVGLEFWFLDEGGWWLLKCGCSM